MVILASTYDQSRYIKAEDLGADRKLRIKNVTEEQIGIGAEKEQKLVVWFTNDERGLVLNRVNNRTLRGAFGDDTAGWAGKIIVVFPAMAEFRGRMVPAVRVRIPPPKKPATVRQWQQNRSRRLLMRSTKLPRTWLSPNADRRKGKREPIQSCCSCKAERD